MANVLGVTWRALLVGVLAAFAGSAMAHESPAWENFSSDTHYGVDDDQGIAYAHCMQWMDDYRATHLQYPSQVNYQTQTLPCTYTEWVSSGVAKGRYTSRLKNTSSGATGSYLQHNFTLGDSCMARGPTARRLYIEGQAPTLACVSGCALAIDAGTNPTPGQNPDTGEPVTYMFHSTHYTGAVCTAPNPDSDEDDFIKEPQPDDPDGQECNPEMGVCYSDDGGIEYCTFNDDDGVPGLSPGDSPSTCVPAIPDQDEDGIPDNRDTDPNDPNNGNDDGSGNETDNEASGGVDCNNQPQCTGDGILCMIAYQTWKTRCAVEQVALAQGEAGSPGGATCAGALTCTGLSPTACFELALQKRNACAAESALEKLDQIAANTAGGTIVTPGDSNLNGDCEAGDTACSDDGTAGMTAESVGGGPGNGEGEGFVPDEAGWLSSRECPAPSSVSIMGQTVDLHIDVFCNFLEVGGALLLLFTAVACAKIVGSAI
jgi:hypothetical protein